ncbi:2'-5' RNA ligase [Candidatus Formimonas warabiya]|uniref:RNA 2',3'-cyclic phosphodiesterase n=2 Tax=Formimonas warabiya TaxID=1761012 RepID=A0A3G1KP50_FORW1|nr:2'-5' RNA ligase [Candidatus Formimonas warabiya]
MRTFIALELNSPVRDQLAQISAPFLGKNREIKWVAPENLHLTLKFLGEITANQCEGIKNALKEICAKHHPFSLTFQGLGAFPHFRSPKIIWAGVNDSAPLLGLVKDISSLIKAGDGKDFRPHITLARIKENSPRLLDVIKDLEEKRSHLFGTVKIEGISFMESVLRPAGPIYQKISFSKLKIVDN